MGSFVLCVFVLLLLLLLLLCVETGNKNKL